MKDKAIGLGQRKRKQTNDRLYYLDVLRAISCLAVIMIHTSSTYVSTDIGGLNFWVGNCFDSISRFAVPVFVMVSGTLFLNEEYLLTLKKLKKHIVKLLSFFCFWSFIYTFMFNLLEPIVKQEQISVVKILYNFIIGHYHLWFIYMIIGLYIITPILRLWVKRVNKRYVEYFILLSVLFSYFLPQIVEIGKVFIPEIESAGNKFIDTINLKFVGGYTAYFILGWYISTFDISLCSIYNRLIWLFSTLFTIVMTSVLSSIANEPVQMYNNLSVNILLQALSIFVLIKTCFGIEDSKSGCFSAIIRFVSSRSLGVYAIHVLFVRLLRIVIRYYFDSALISILLVYCFTLVLSLILVSIMQRIPFIKEFV